jgi:hypothetical protein
MTTPPPILVYSSVVRETKIEMLQLVVLVGRNGAADDYGAEDGG